MSVDIGTIRTNTVDNNYVNPSDLTKSTENLVRLTRDEIDGILKNYPDNKITLESGLLDIEHAFKTNKALGSILRDLNESKPTYILDVRHGVIQKKKFTQSENHSSEKSDKVTQTDKQSFLNINQTSEVKKSKNILGVPKINAGVAAGIAAITVGLVRLIKDIVDLCGKVNNDEQYDEIGEDSASRAVNDKIDSDFHSYQEAINSGDADKIAEIKEEMAEKYYTTPEGDFVFSASYVKQEYNEGELSDIANSAREEGINTAKQPSKDINRSDFATDSVITGLGLLTIGASLSSYRSSKKDIATKQLNNQSNSIDHQSSTLGTGSKYAMLDAGTSRDNKNIISEREQTASMLNSDWR